MSYSGIICTLSNVRKHPNADRLMIASAIGYSVIVGADSKDGDIGIIFPADGKLSDEMCLNNNLYRKHPVTGEKMGGYLESNGRIKAVKLRGQISDGLFLPLSSVEWARLKSLKVGDEISDKRICEKYFTPATIRAMNGTKAYKKPWWVPRQLESLHKRFVVSRKTKDPCPDFKKHFDTTKLRQYKDMIPEGLTVYFSSKMHGTSARSGFVKYDNRGIVKKIFRVPIKFSYVMGTRNITYNPFKGSPDGYYKNSVFRQQCHQTVINKGLKKNEVIYYEIVGYTGGDSKIMPDHSISDKDLKDSGIDVGEFRSMYGDTLSYTYGCQPGQLKIFVYRITQDGIDLSNDRMIKRCKELELDVVPQLFECDSSEDLLKIAERLSRDQDGDGQLREGVCLRLEDSDGNLIKILKYKSFVFCLCEGIQKNTDEYIDIEEIS